jgi:hypothetical protein
VSDFRTDRAAFSEYYAHLVEFESLIQHFYCDANHLVTVGIGHLVDREGGADAVGQGLARALARRGDVAFTLRGVGVDVDAVVADWQRVKDHGRTHPETPGGRFGTVAQLRITEQSVRNLLNDKVTEFADQLYRNRPFMLEYDPHVAIALIDARYNPATIRLYEGTTPEIPKMWNALDPRHKEFNPGRAVSLFESTWAYKQSVPMRYIQRHHARTQFMRKGLGAMGYDV